MRNKITIYRGKKMAERLFDVYEKRIQTIHKVLLTIAFGVGAISNYKKINK